MEHWHTPGPWDWSHREIPGGNYSTQVYDANGKEIATIAWYPVRENNVTTTSRVANARLIAAAPDLLSATIQVEAILAQIIDQPSDTLNKLRAAIAKATGGST